MTYYVNAVSCADENRNPGYVQWAAPTIDIGAKGGPAAARLISISDDRGVLDRPFDEWAPYTQNPTRRSADPLAHIRGVSKLECPFHDRTTEDQPEHRLRRPERRREAGQRTHLARDLYGLRPRVLR